jgi:chemotaxis protein CheD
MLKVVGMADMKISNAGGDIIVTYALGSCIGLTAYDPVTKVGGMMHAMMPDSKIDPQRSKENPFMFVDTGFPLLISECLKYGAKIERLQIKAAGCSALKTGHFFKIGYKNFNCLNELLSSCNLSLQSYDVGGEACAP